MKILGLITARGGSKGVPGKNIKPLCGKPLIQYTIESAINSKLLTKICLSSDDDEIINFCKKFNISVPFKRPKGIASDNSKSIDVVIHALKYYNAIGEYFDAVCLLQPTYPFRRKGLIDEAIIKFKKTSADSLISVLEVPHHYNPHWVFQTKKSNFLEIATGEKHIISRRQELPTSYHRDGAIYITKSDIVLREKSLYGKKISFILSDDNNYINIDTMKDWKMAEKKVKYFNQKKGCVE